MSNVRNRIGVGLLAAACVFLIGTIAIALWTKGQSPADPENAQQVALGKSLYDRHCAACHGAKLEGQPDWKERLPNGRLPAPPHDASGHTWHHPDEVLFGITRLGLVPGKFAPPKYESDMPAFAGILADSEIWATLAYIKNTWPSDIRQAQAEIDREYRRR